MNAGHCEVGLSKPRTWQQSVDIFWKSAECGSYYSKAWVSGLTIRWYTKRHHSETQELHISLAKENTDWIRSWWGHIQLLLHSISQLKESFQPCSESNISKCIYYRPAWQSHCSGSGSCLCSTRYIHAAVAVHLGFFIVSPQEIHPERITHRHFSTVRNK